MKLMILRRGEIARINKMDMIREKQHQSLLTYLIFLIMLIL